MKIRITFEVGEWERAAIADIYGDKRLATYREVRDYIESTVYNAIGAAVGELHGKSAEIIKRLGDDLHGKDDP